VPFVGGPLFPSLITLYFLYFFEIEQRRVSRFGFGTVPVPTPPWSRRRPEKELAPSEMFTSPTNGLFFP